jgi:hypothetical protein
MRQNKQPSDSNDYGKYIGLSDFHEKTRLEQRRVEDLMAQGFFWEEAVKLVRFHEHLYENAEMRQRLEEDEYMLFARWLYEQGAINEGEENEQ